MSNGTHTFPYIQFGKYHLPIIPLFLRYRDITIEYHALVDSGADFTLFHADVADIFGINLERAKKESVSGIGGDAIAYQCIFDISLDQRTFFPAPVLLSPDITLDRYGIVGQVGFFNKFVVEFTYEAKQIALTSLR